MSIHDAIESGKIPAVRKYIAAGEDLEARDGLRRTLLHIAAERGQTAIVRLLIDNEADVSASDYRKFTPLHNAAGVGASEIVEALLQAGADPKAKNAFKSTPLHELADGGGVAPAKKRLSIVEQLLDAGGPIDPLDSSGRTPLWFAASTGTSALPRAVMKARLSVLELLLERGADPTRKASGELGTPLDAAHGRHQPKKYRIVWPDAVALLEANERPVAKRSRPKKNP
jgi:ankyrin repeat protein